MKKKLLNVFAAMFLTLPMMAFDPPMMGWSTWNTFALKINEQLIRNQADAMVKTGLKKVGYQYINIDDGYWNGRGDDNQLRINTQIFPSGMRALSDYIHHLGLKAGIYSDAGDNSCSSGNMQSWGMNVGLYHHEKEDCELYFNKWNYDFIKVDYCGGVHLGLNSRDRYTSIHQAILATGRKNVKLNLCYGAYQGTWVSSVGDSWRVTNDIYCDWYSPRSIPSIIRECLYISAYTGGGHYSDMDMLEIGRTLSHDEEITHFGIWCMWSSPLIIGCDLTNIPEFSLNLLKNQELIAINQDRLGLMAPVIDRKDEVYVFAKDLKKLHGPQRAVAITNLSEDPQQMTLDLGKAGFEGSVKVRDAVNHQDLPNQTTSFNVSIPAHGTQVFILTGRRNQPIRYEAETAWLKEYQELNPATDNAHYMPNEIASQGELVRFLGNRPTNYMEWRNVYVKKSGTYNLTVGYISPDARQFTLSVNNKQARQLQATNTVNTNSVGTCSTKVYFRKGFNTVRLSNDKDWAPDIDYMDITPN